MKGDWRGLCCLRFHTEDVDLVPAWVVDGRFAVEGHDYVVELVDVGLDLPSYQ